MCSDTVETTTQTSASAAALSNQAKYQSKVVRERHKTNLYYNDTGNVSSVFFG